MEKDDLNSELGIQKNPFRVPQNYFDELEEKIQLHIHQKHSQTKFIPLLNSKLAIAASIILMLGFTILFVNKPSTSTADLSFQEIDSLIETNSYLISEEALISYIEDENLDLFLSEKTADEDIIDYLSEENLDYEDIVQQSDI